MNARRSSLHPVSVSGGIGGPEYLLLTFRIDFLRIRFQLRKFNRQVYVSNVWIECTQMERSPSGATSRPLSNIVDRQPSCLLAFFWNSTVQPLHHMASGTQLLRYIYPFQLAVAPPLYHKPILVGCNFFAAKEFHSFPSLCINSMRENYKEFQQHVVQALLETHRTFQCGVS